MAMSRSLGWTPHDRAIADPHVAARRLEKPGDDVEQGGLPAARRPQQHQELAIGQREVDALEHLDAVEALADLVENQGAHRAAPWRQARLFRPRGAVEIAAEAVFTPRRSASSVACPAATDERKPALKASPAPIVSTTATSGPARGRSRGLTNRQAPRSARASRPPGFGAACRRRADRAAASGSLVRVSATASTSLRRRWRQRASQPRAAAIVASLQPSGGQPVSSAMSIDRGIGPGEQRIEVAAEPRQQEDPHESRMPPRSRCRRGRTAPVRP